MPPRPSMSTPTSRRSSRLNPLPRLVLQSEPSSEIFEGEISSRLLKPEEDLQELEREGDETGTVTFYKSFKRPREQEYEQKKKKGKAKGKAKADDEEIFRVGDTVLVDMDTRVASIGVLTQLWEVHLDRETEDDEDQQPRKYARVHWFLRYSQLANVRVHREHEENEIYYTVAGQSEDALPLALILQHCTVSSTPKSSEERPSKKPTVLFARDLEPQEFVCYYSVDPRKGLYYPFYLEEKVASGKEDGDWNVHPKQEATVQPTPKKDKKKNLTSSRKRPVETSSEEEDDDMETDVYEPDEDATALDEDKVEDGTSSSRSASPESEIFTPSKRKRNAPDGPSPSKTKTPRKARVNFVEPTPNSKAILAKRAAKARGKGRTPVTPSKRRVKSLKSISTPTKWAQNLPKDPHLRALATLHVSATPDDLPCRTTEFEDVLGAVEGLLEEGDGGCVYISGVPGTGKTATVHAVVRTLHERAEAGEIPPFTFLPLNGLKLPDAREAYVELWRVVSEGETSGRKTGSAEALKGLVGRFDRGGRNKGPNAISYVVLMDELDQLITAKQDVVYNFFNWPTLPNSRLVVIAVANTMDLPERVMSGKVRSRLGMRRINFQPYTSPQLIEIVQSRLRDRDDQQTASTREMMEHDAIKLVAMKVAGVSGDARRVLDICRRAVELARAPDGTWKTVTPPVVQEVMKQMQNSPAATYLRECSFMEKVMLVAVVKEIRKQGVSEVKWGEVANLHSVAAMALAPVMSPPLRPSLLEQRLVLNSLLASHALLFEEGTLASRKAETERKICLGLESGEIERVLGDYGNDWKTWLGL